ncbi:MULTISPECIES: endolytic transglycosylase MltG [Oceanimonas]|uniref:Endolytic murein transglycosylase n=1 Tax=Oceanimonas smirnovii TaxID=264574 RepID=A0ABW7P4R0_9GAMM|nr:endolytic transglycosylase MltG [Oceanimonas sp. CAM02]MDV2858692.1 endolytic transglycosylase MltG [Oceanimonas sp. CAM02]
MSKLINAVKGTLLAGVLAGAGLAGYGYSQWQKIEHLTITPGEHPLFVVHKGETALQLAGRLSPELPLLHRRLWLKFHPELAAVRQGTYKLDDNTTLREALNTFVDGDVYRLNVTLVEGLRLSDWLGKLASAEYMEHELEGVSEAELAERLGAGHSKLEGLFLPETYTYTPGDSDYDVLERAYGHMQTFLQDAWENREPDLPVDSPYEALILASIIEKETGIAEERPLIASVFINRLRRGMRLQTDPTVIYGMGDDYDGNIRKRDLQAHTPYNTYVIDGLPPTPIAMPSQEAIQAVLNPAKSKYYYFVAKGEGRHHFSRTLREHNNAVRRYILNR